MPRPGKEGDVLNVAALVKGDCESVEENGSVICFVVSRAVCLYHHRMCLDHDDVGGSAPPGMHVCPFFDRHNHLRPCALDGGERDHIYGCLDRTGCGMNVS